MQKRVWGRERVGEREGERNSASAREGILNHITYAPHRPRWAACELCFCVSRGEGQGDGDGKGQGAWGGTPLVCCGHNGSSLSSYWSWSCRLLCTGYGLHVPRCCVINWPCCIWVAKQVAEWRQPTSYIPTPPFISLCPTPAASTPLPLCQVSHYKGSSKSSHNWVLFSVVVVVVVLLPPVNLKWFRQPARGGGRGRQDKESASNCISHWAGNLCWMCETV